MKDIFRKIVRPLDLRAYAPEMETEIQVWVNPPRGMLVENSGLEAAAREIRAELETLASQVDLGVPDGDLARKGKALAEKLAEIGGAQMEIMAQIWSQGSDPDTHWSADEIRALFEKGIDTDPALWGWLRSKTFLMISEYRAGQKKA